MIALSTMVSGRSEPGQVHHLTHTPGRQEQRLRRSVFFALVGATLWLGAVLVAWDRYELSARPLAVPVALLPFAGVLLWARREPPG